MIYKVEENSLFIQVYNGLALYIKGIGDEISVNEKSISNRFYEGLQIGYWYEYQTMRKYQMIS